MTTLLAKVHRLRFLTLFVVLAAPAATAGEFTIGDRTFRLADGFIIERIAGPPLVNRPITAALDETGALYVADSSGSNDNVQTQLAQKPHRIVKLVDSDEDGVYDRQTVFADHMMFPEGTMWLDGSLYVAAPPSIWKLTDTNGDGVADQRVEWFQGKTLTGCANDLHGPYAGPDGWIYWCKGAFAEQRYERPGREPFVTSAAHIFRSRRDGSGIEPVMTGGMDNPVDVVFTPGGERIFTTTFLVRPGGGDRDGLIHAIYGGIYGKLHAPIYAPVHRWTAPEVMPVLLHMGPAAPCGLTRYESAALGPEYRDNLFACYFNLHKVSRHVLTPRGATFTTRDEDFLSSTHVDFHPTDVIEDDAGGLIVVDTGGWYKLCCPSSQLHKPDVLGAVYRVSRKGNVWSAREGRIARAAAAGLDALDDPRGVVRRRAMDALARSKDPGIISRLGPESAPLRTPLWRENAVWTLTRIDRAEARAAVRGYLGDADATVRQAAIHSCALARDRDAADRLIVLLSSGGEHNRRAAAEALGRIGTKAAVPALLQALGQPHDRVLDHSLTYALIEIGDARGTAAGLASANPAVVRAAMVALDQMRQGGLEPRYVAGKLAATDPALKATAGWIVGHHPEWAAELAGVLGAQLDRQDLPTPERAELEARLGALAQSPPIQQMLARRLEDPVPASVQSSALRAMAHAPFKEKETPDLWIRSLARALARPDASRELLGELIATARALPIPADRGQSLVKPLLAIARNQDLPHALRTQALAATPGGLVEPEPAVFTFLIAQLDPARPTPERTTAADVLARARLNQQQLLALADAAAAAGPLELDRLLFAFEQSTDSSVGLRLIDSLAKAHAFASLRADALKARLAKYNSQVQKALQPLLSRLNVDADKQRARLDQLVSALSAGDVRRGQRVFLGDKASCYACHAIGYRGGNVGPDLTRIGRVRSERDLLESIVFPSASFVRSFEPVAISTTDGKIHNGLIKGETADEIILATGVNQTERVARKEIDAMQPSKVSIMPAGLDQQLTPQELADLVAFLRACR